MIEGPVAVLLNPTAGRGRHAALANAVYQALRSHGHSLRPISADTAEEALATAKAAVADGAAALVAVGGDGTMHLGLQAVGGTAVPFGIVPAGTGNDFATEMGMPANPVTAAQAIATALAAGRTRKIDLARMIGPGGYDHWFGAVLGAGFDAIVNERANAMRWPRGPFRYDLATYAELLRLKPRPYRLTIDGAVHELKAVLVAVGNTSSYGGGMRICPAADATDGQIDILVGGAISRLTLVRLKSKLYEGTHVSHPLCTTFRARTVTIEAAGITTYVDGERACALPVTVTAEPGALTLLA